MPNEVLVDKDWMIRVLKFLDASAGEGIWFRDFESYPDELDAACVFIEMPGLYDDDGNVALDWLPDDLRENWRA